MGSNRGGEGESPLTHTTALLLEISKGRLKQWRPEYVDALCQYFGVPVGELLIADAVDLPLDLNLCRILERGRGHLGQENLR